MNVLNLEVRIKKIKIKTNDNSSICFSLRLGRILSGLSNTIMNVNNKNNGQLDTNIQLSLACEQSILISNNRASLVVYEVHSNQTKDIIGMVFILFNNQQGQIQRYKIQQSTDPNSFIQLTFNITALQVKERQNQSLASKSSLAEIKQLHRVLTRGHKRSISEYSYSQSQTKKARHSPNQRQKTKNSNKIQHLKSQQSPVIQNDEDQINLKLRIKKYEQQITKQRQRNSILINLLVVQEQKNTQSQNFIKNIVNTLQNIQNTKNQPSINNNITNIQFQLKYTQKQKFLLKQQITKHQITKQNELHIQTLIKQRDQLYSISHQLYEKTKKYKDQNEQLHNNIKIIQSQLKISAINIQQLRNQNIQFKKQIFDLNYKKQIQGTDLITQLNKINEENKNLKKENIEYERKFKQSFRAIQQFKNDAWKAQEQIIIKDHVIQSLKQQLSQLKRQTQNLRQYQSSHQISLLENNNSQAQKLCKTSQAFKQMTQLIIKNNIERFNLLQNMNQKQKQFESRPMKSEISIILSGIKQKIGQIYNQYEKQNKKSIPILEMRRKITQIMNSTTI